VTISGSRVSGMNGNASGTTAGFAGYRLATDCQADGIVNSGSGTSAAFLPPTAGQTFRCVVEGSSASGVLCLSASAVVRCCTVHLNGSGTGIDVRNTAGVIEDNAVSQCATGIAVTGSNGLVVKNRITTCNTNLSAGVTSQTGPLVSATGVIASTNPWANFTD
jgi:parallel beta-helix repeat protein